MAWWGPGARPTGGSRIRDRGEKKLKSEVAREIGRYRLLSELGRGSSGIVYLAEDPNIERKVALKVYSPETVDPEMEAEFRQRFLTEAKAAGRLSHPGIVTIYDAGTDAVTGSCYIAMAWVEGQTLHEYLWRQGGRLSPARAAELVRQAAFALDYAHREGVVHRDVKPANVLVGEDGRVRVMDFGVAKLARQNLTAAGVVLGTPAYMAPEQVRTGEVDGRSDLFSLGTILYECLTGVNPFAAQALSDVTFKVINEEVAPAASLDPRIPAALSAVAERALAKDPAERFQTGGEMARALESAAAADEPALDDLDDLEGLPPLDSTAFSVDSAAAAPPPRRTYKPWVAAVLVLAAAGLWLLWGRPSAAPGEPGPAATPTAPAEGGSGEVAAGAPAGAVAEPAPIPEAGTEEQPTDPRPGVDLAELDLVYVNRLREGRFSVRVDGAEVWSREVGAKNPFKRLAAGQRHHIALPVAAGERSIEVRIAAPSGIDAKRTIAGTFTAGETRRLEVVLRRRANELELGWLD